MSRSPTGDGGQVAPDPAGGGPAAGCSLGAPATAGAKTALLVATGCGIGMVPVFPGTAASALGVGIAWLLHPLPWPAYLAAVGGLAAVGVSVAGRAQRVLGLKDPSVIVIDEIVGMLLVLAFLPATPYEMSLGFLLFRIFDVVKPYPVAAAEALPGGWGIILDDLVAALYAAATWWLLKANFDFL